MHAMINQGGNYPRARDFNLEKMFWSKVTLWYGRLNKKLKKKTPSELEIDLTLVF